MLRGEVQLDDTASGPRVLVEVEPLDGRRQAVPGFAAACRCMVARSGRRAKLEQQLARWDFHARRFAADSTRKSNGGTSFEFPLQLPADVPTTNRPVELWVRLMPEERRETARPHDDGFEPRRAGSRPPKLKPQRQQPHPVQCRQSRLRCRAAPTSSRIVRDAPIPASRQSGWTIARPGEIAKPHSGRSESTATWRIATQADSSGRIDSGRLNRCRFAITCRPSAAWRPIRRCRGRCTGMVAGTPHRSRGIASPRRSTASCLRQARLVADAVSSLPALPSLAYTRRHGRSGFLNGECGESASETPSQSAIERGGSTGGICGSIARWHRGGLSASPNPAGYATITFAELDADATRIARGLVAWGVHAGHAAGAVGAAGDRVRHAGVRAVAGRDGDRARRSGLGAAESHPLPGGGRAGGICRRFRMAQAVRVLLRHKFPRAKWNVTVGRRWFWGGLTLEQLRRARRCGTRSRRCCLTTHADDPAAIIFTSGSTGPPKGVLYTHRMFDTQVAEIQSTYGIEPGGVDLSCFPLFALFNSAMGVTTVLPDMDFSRPASADPQKLLAAANDWQVTQAFASPAVWRMLERALRQDGRADRLAAAGVFVRRAGAGRRAAATLACVGAGRQDAHAVRRDRVPARGHDRSGRSARRNGGPHRRGRRRVRRPASSTRSSGA